MGKKFAVTLFVCLALAGAGSASHAGETQALPPSLPDGTAAPYQAAYILAPSAASESALGEAPLPSGPGDRAGAAEAEDDAAPASGCANHASCLFTHNTSYGDEAGANFTPACTEMQTEGQPSHGSLLTFGPGGLTANDCMEDEAVAALPEVPIVVNQKVESFIKYFQTRGRKHFERWLSRQSSYMPAVQRILRENGMPEDLFYIALIESGLNPKARSRAKAVGMWQFIKGTARKYGLRVDWWIDERMDPEKATEAAAKYFKDLYGQFGSWYLAAAGYNAGEGRILRAMRKHKTDDFWLMAGYKKPLKRETRDYVPKYIAAMLIAKDPAAYGFEAGEYEDSLDYEKVRVAQATDINVIAQAAGTTVAEIRRLNPELLLWFTPPDYPDYEIKLPAGSTEKFLSNISAIPPAQMIKFHEHKVKKGDTISNIARIYGTTAKPILYLNNLKRVKSIRPGTTIIVPVRADANGKKGRKVADALRAERAVSLQ
ncbi:MAG: transglycosylase SLT domain-containing protein [Deltaproteobacteria bacterium]|nr:transglycosylase SLT domain-containing protein [Deltaproteobacteria bacterium]